MPQPRKPTALHELTGAYKHDPQRKRARSGEPDPNGPIGDPPASMPAGQQSLWHEYVSIAPPGVMCRADRKALQALCIVDALAMAGKMEAIKELRHWLAKFGLTPADRSRVSVAKPDAADEWDGLIN